MVVKRHKYNLYGIFFIKVIRRGKERMLPVKEG
jgi:hypothetical protein